MYDYTWNEGDNWAVNEEPIVIELPEELQKLVVTNIIDLKSNVN